MGAGPGDPALLTLQALDRLRQADLVLYDALVAPEIVALAQGAQCFCVGKRAGRRSVRQETIIRLLVRAARRGRRVVRLKGGDPYVLGRGGEEALALRAAGIGFEVVPGLTTAVTAPALAGIPMTHRGAASGFAVVSGHDESSFRPVLDALPPGSLTVVVLMGLARRAAVASCLLDRGWPADTPAAIVVRDRLAADPHVGRDAGATGDGPAPGREGRPRDHRRRPRRRPARGARRDAAGRGGGRRTRGPELVMTGKDGAVPAGDVRKSPATRGGTPRLTMGNRPTTQPGIHAGRCAPPRQAWSGGNRKRRRRLPGAGGTHRRSGVAGIPPQTAGDGWSAR